MALSISAKPLPDVRRRDPDVHIASLAINRILRLGRPPRTAFGLSRSSRAIVGFRPGNTRKSLLKAAVRPRLELPLVGFQRMEAMMKRTITRRQGRTPLRVNRCCRVCLLNQFGLARPTKGNL